MKKNLKPTSKYWSLLAVLLLVGAAGMYVGSGPAWADDEPVATEEVTTETDEVTTDEEVPATDEAGSEDDTAAAGGEEESAGAPPPASEADDTAYTINTLIMFVCAVLVLFMQAGFAMVEVGLNAAKNTVNILFKNVMDVSVGVLLFFVVGYGLMYPRRFQTTSGSLSVRLVLPSVQTLRRATTGALMLTSCSRLLLPLRPPRSYRVPSPAA